MARPASAFPSLDGPALSATRGALHGYARVLGEWLTRCRTPRKHWWQASLRPSLRGMTTGVIYAGVECELELDVQNSQLHGWTSAGEEMVEALRGQAPGDVADRIAAFLGANGLAERFHPNPDQPTDRGESVTTYSVECSRSIARTWSAITATMTELQADIREETSPIQLWPHHFDLAMAWLPGEKVPGQSLENEEYADKQMSFGFTLGDDTIHEPYFYVTAYPLPDGFSELPLPAGTTWWTEGFNGAVLPYRSLLETSDPNGYLLELWRQLLSAGRDTMLSSQQ